MQLFKNNITVFVNQTALANSTQITLDDTSSLPIISGPDYFYITFFKYVNNIEQNWEIVKVNSVVGNVIYCNRGQEGTTARDWDAGSVGQMRSTAKTMSDIIDALALKTNNASAAITGGSIVNTPISGAAGSFTTLSASGNANITGEGTSFGNGINLIQVGVPANQWGLVVSAGMLYLGSTSNSWGTSSLEATFSPNGLSVTGALNTSGIKEDAAGNVGIGVTPSAWGSLKALDVSSCGAVFGFSNQTGMAGNAFFDGTSWVYKANGPATNYTQIEGVQQWSSAPSGTAGQPITFTQDMSLTGGNLLVGVASGSYHTIIKSGSAGDTILAVNDAVKDSLRVCVSDQSGFNAALAAVKMGYVVSTGRSLEAGGTLNASGADYAEYENNNGLTIAKSSIVGFKADGTLTLTFADAIRFGIKSTDPSYVGGDTWGSEDQVGQRPEKPCYVAPIYEGAPNPGDKPAEPAPSLPPAPTQQDGETDETCAIRTAQWQEYCATATTAHQAALAAYAESIAAWDAANAAWQDDDASYQGKVIAMQSAHEYAMARYEEALADFEVRLEAARQQVDRVAYSGKVPVNVMGATPGGYIVPVEGADGQIAGEFVADPDFAQYKRAVGRVNRILEDGRCEVAVMVH